MKRIFTFLLFIACVINLIHAENGYELWLRYKRIDDSGLYRLYRKENSYIFMPCTSDKFLVAKYELEEGFSGLLNLKLNNVKEIKDRKPSANPVS